MDIEGRDTGPSGSNSGSKLLDSLPIEVVVNVLKHVGSPKNILNFALASKACYNTAFAFIYRNVDWTIGPVRPEMRAAAMRSVSFLLANPEILSVTRVLRVSEKKLDVSRDTKLCLDYSLNEVPTQPPRKLPKWHIMHNAQLPINRSFPETFRAMNYILQLLPRFSGLRELTLRSITLPRTFYQSVHALSDLNLRRVTIRYCRLTTRYPAGYDPATLQLTELTIFNVYAKLRKVRALLKLARSPTLRTLRLDRTIERGLGSLAACGLPPSVHTLELDWRGNAQPGRNSCELLYFFLNSCKFVRHLELTDMGKLDSMENYPQDRRLKSTALPSLTSITVPITYLELLLPGRAIDSVTITDTTLRETSSMNPILKFLTVDEIAEVLRIMQNSSITLSSFKFNLKTWDKELFYMLATKQGKLKDLYVSFQYGEVDDAFAMTLGNIIEFPLLERLHLYRFGDKMAGSEDGRFVDHKEYMIIWQLYMTNLYEVALSSDVIWVRSPSPLLAQAQGGRKAKRTWSQYAIEPMSGVEGLLTVPCPKEAKRYEAMSRERRPRSYTPATVPQLGPHPHHPNFIDNGFGQLNQQQQFLHQQMLEYANAMEHGQIDEQDGVMDFH